MSRLVVVAVVVLGSWGAWRSLRTRPRTPRHPSLPTLPRDEPTPADLDWLWAQVRAALRGEVR